MQPKAFVFLAKMSQCLNFDANIIKTRGCVHGAIHFQRKNSRNFKLYGRFLVAECTKTHGHVHFQIFFGCNTPESPLPEGATPRLRRSPLAKIDLLSFTPSTGQPPNPT
jgi:hypothetical protein